MDGRASQPNRDDRGMVIIIDTIKRNTEIHSRTLHPIAISLSSQDYHRATSGRCSGSGSGSGAPR